MRILESELILNADGSVYHLNLKPEHVAHTIITVGDPDRVATVTNYFDTIEFSTRKREFCTQTGTYKGKRITVISTGIGTDNIDIVFNELDALVNIDFETRMIKEEFTQLNFFRIGTSGGIQEHISIDSFLASAEAIGFDNLIHFYEDSSHWDQDLTDAFVSHMSWNPKNSEPYCVSASDALLSLFPKGEFLHGITGTNVGFYGPQGRKLRLGLQDGAMNDKLQAFNHNGKQITNLEMETSAIYGLAKLMGHQAVSLNVILANRANGTFSQDPKEAVNRLIQKVLDSIVA
ncbi:MAG: nucleoside phosphorylase [Aureisphaera sp.]